MTFSDLSIRRPVFAWMIMAGLLVFGWLGFRSMGISLLPDVDFPVVTATITLENAAPEVIETQVTDIVEDAVMGIEGLKEVSSVSTDGQSTVTMEFHLGRDIDTALQEAQTRIAQAQRNLPKDIDPPVVTKTNPEDQPIMWIALSGTRPLKDLMSYTDGYLKDRFTTISGVGDIFLGGYVDPNLRVWLDEGKMRRDQLTVEDVINAVQTQHLELPAGDIDTGPRDINVRVMGEAATPAEFARIAIQSRSGLPIWKRFTIGDVGTVEDGLDDVRRISRTDGRQAVGIGIRKQRGANAVATALLVRARVAELQKTLPPGMTLTIVNDSTRFIEQAARELDFTLLLSVLLTSAVCWLFLGSWSSTLNVLLAIPTSIVGAFLVLYFMGFTLNTFTLLGLSLAIGIVVDDAIMMLENIIRYNEKGYGRITAAIIGAREITFPAVASSAAILAIFLPVVFMKGIVGRFFYQFGVTMAAAVALSLLEAVTLTPMRCSEFVDAERTLWIARAMDRLMEKVRALYLRALRPALENRWKVLGGAALVFAGSLALLPLIPKEFVPPQDQSQFLVRMETPIGSSIEFTDAVVKKAEAWCMAQPDVATYFSAVGGFGGGQINSAMMFVTLKPPSERRPLVPGGRRPTQRQFMAAARAAFNAIPGMQRAVMQDLSLSGFTAQRGFPVEFTVRGPDWDKLGALSGSLMDAMKASGKMTDVDTDYLTGMPELRIVPDRAKAAARGVSVAAIADAVNAMIGGVRVGKYTKGGKRYDIRVRLTGRDRARPADVDRIWVRNDAGEVVPLREVVTMTEKPALLSISRRNRERAISIFANPAQGVSQAEALAEVRRIAAGVLPPGYRLVFSGGSETFQESFRSLLFALVLGIFVAYMVLASQFNSFVHPFTVLLALPFSVTGAFLALLAGGQSLNIYSMIGIILLMGIVKKNSILLVDFANSRRKAGMAPREALLDACPVRLRPILMTSFATVAAAVPPALGLGPGAETRVPMALVVIGGVLFSTLLTLLVVPCAYSLLAGLERRGRDAEIDKAFRAADGAAPPGSPAA